jgi:protein TonB
LRVGGGEKDAPRKTRHVNPAYPPDALRARIQGVVILECTIDELGKVSHVTVQRGHELLSGAAIKAVEQWEYEPTLLNGVPVPVIMTVTVNFKLS